MRSSTVPVSRVKSEAWLRASLLASDVATGPCTETSPQRWNRVLSRRVTSLKPMSHLGVRVNNSQSSRPARRKQP